MDYFDFYSGNKKVKCFYFNNYPTLFQESIVLGSKSFFETQFIHLLNNLS